MNHNLGRFINAFAELESMFEDCDLLFCQALSDPCVDDPLCGYLSIEQLRWRGAAVFRNARRSGKPIAWNLAGHLQGAVARP